ncbi:MAG: hypothetical protein Q4B67_03195 [Eubacteriales bacterium]|nr:hypothetical protein [Eubacteriales bacterium]
MKKTLKITIIAAFMGLLLAGTAFAKNVTAIDVSQSGKTVTVTGEAEAGMFAAMVQIKDSEGTVLAMKSVPVSEGKFTAVISRVALFSGNDYLAVAADFDGGPWTAKAFTADGGGSSDDTDDDFVTVTYVTTGTGSWDMPTSGTWTLGANGKWQFSNASFKPFKNTWGMVVNPYARAGQHTSDWFWFDADGNMATGFRVINGKTYYFNESSDGTLGAMQTGFVKVGNDWYYFAETKDSNGGAMQTGWVQKGGKWYFLKADGKMAVNTTTPDGYKVDATGART